MIKIYKVCQKNNNKIKVFLYEKVYYQGDNK